MLRARLEARLPIQQQRDAIKHTARPLVARDARVSGKIGEIAICRPDNATRARLRADEAHQSRHEQRRNTAENKCAVGIQDGRKIRGVGRL